MQRYTDTVQRTNGNAVSGAAITVYEVGTSTLATLYSDDGVTSLANPVYSGTDGEYRFYAANGKYTLSITRAGFTSDSKEVCLFDPADAGIISVKNYGAVTGGVTECGAALQDAFDAAFTSGAELEMPPGVYLSGQQLTMNRCRVSGSGATIKFTGLGASTDCLILQGSTAENPLVLHGVNIDANSTGRDAVVLAGGAVGYSQADHLRIEGLRITGAVRDGIHIEPAAAAYWLENLVMRNVRVLNPGRHGLACIVPALSTVFVNKVSLYDFEVRGAGQTTTGYDIYADCQGSTSGQKASEWVVVNPQFDAADAANHGQASIRLERSGSSGSFDCWTFVGGTFEDVGTVITGFPDVVSLGAGAAAEGLACFGGAIVDYGDFADYAAYSILFVQQGVGGRNIIKMDGSIKGAGLLAGNAAISDSSTLDWYEEGTWTPAVTFGGAAVGVTYGTQDGTFTRTGNRVEFTAVLVLTSKGSSTGSMLINGLPYASTQSNGVAYSVIGTNLAAGVAAIYALGSGTTSIRVDKFAAGAVTQLADTDLANNSVLRVSGQYRA